MPRPARTRAAAPAATQLISSFTRVSKSTVVPEKSIKPISVAPSATIAVLLPTTSRKRKASTADESPDARTRPARHNISFPLSSSEDEAEAPSKRACRREEPQLLALPKPTKRTAGVKGKRVAKTTPSRSQTAHNPGHSTIISTSRRGAKTIQTKLDASFKKQQQGPAKDGKLSSNDLPSHLVELLHLHKAFLKTIMIHFAHHGTSSPVDIRTIAPHIARSWGKRQVTVEDIRRCLALQASAQHGIKSPFIVSDYGRGRVCVELDTSGQQSGDAAAAVNEGRLCRQVEDSLRDLCAERATDQMTDVDITLESLSLADLPKAAVANMDSSARKDPVLTKGHRALNELKNGIIVKQQEKDAKQSAPSVSSTMLNPDGSKMNLLDRLRLKQLAKAEGPLPPSGPELQRRAALNRVADVAATISMLSLSNPLSLPRQAFTMAAILERLKDSLRVPLSSEEGGACVRLISSEVAPEWLRIVAIGGRENVVVQRNGQPVDRVIHERVQKLMG